DETDRKGSGDLVIEAEERLARLTEPRGTRVRAPRWRGRGRRFVRCRGRSPASRLRPPFPRAERGCPMTETLRRRDVVKAVAAAGGLLALGGLAGAAEPDKEDKLAGEWLYAGKEDQPCALFRQGRVLLLDNENGELATGRVTGATKLVVLKGDGWEEGLVGELAQGGQAILSRALSRVELTVAADRACLQVLPGRRPIRLARLLNGTVRRRGCSQWQSVWPSPATDITVPCGGHHVLADSLLRAGRRRRAVRRDGRRPDRGQDRECGENRRGAIECGPH